MQLHNGFSGLTSSEEKYEPIDVVIHRGGGWHVDGVEKTPTQILHNTDAVFNALHREYGEDGTVQKVLDSLMIPYTGSTAFSSAVSMNKLLTKQGIEF